MLVALRALRNDGSGPVKDYRTLVAALGVVGGAELSDVPRHLKAGDQFGIAGLSAQGRQSGAVALFGDGESRPAFAISPRIACSLLTQSLKDRSGPPFLSDLPPVRLFRGKFAERQGRVRHQRKYPATRSAVLPPRSKPERQCAFVSSSIRFASHERSSFESFQKSHIPAPDHAN